MANFWERRPGFLAQARPADARTEMVAANSGGQRESKKAAAKSGDQSKRGPSRSLIGSGAWAKKRSPGLDPLSSAWSQREVSRSATYTNDFDSKSRAEKREGPGRVSGRALSVLGILSWRRRRHWAVTPCFCRHFREEAAIFARRRSIRKAAAIFPKGPSSAPERATT